MYVLYVAAEANFQTRSMLIPADKFQDTLECETLRQAATNNIITLVYERDNYKITEIEQPCSDIVHQMTLYAFGVTDEDMIREKDLLWYEGAITNLCEGFNHTQNYNMLLQKYKNLITESFLVLEKIKNKKSLVGKCEINTQCAILLVQLML